MCGKNSVQTKFLSLSKINSVFANKNRHRISKSIFGKSTNSGSNALILTRRKYFQAGQKWTNILCQNFPTTRYVFNEDYESAHRNNVLRKVKVVAIFLSFRDQSLWIPRFRVPENRNQTASRVPENETRTGLRVHENGSRIGSQRTRNPIPND